MDELLTGLELTLLGSPHVMLNRERVTGFITSKAEALFYYLALTGRPHARTVLASLFWPDVPEVVARKNLRDIIFNLRKLLGDYLTITRQTVAFNQQAPHWIDVARIQSLLYPHLEECTFQELQEAIGLYHGDLLDGFYVRDAVGFEEWLTVEREQLRTVVSHAMHQLVAYYLDAAAWNEGLQLTQRLLAMESWDEAAHRQQMRLLAGSGHRGAALAQYERCRQVMADEFGIEPAHETHALYLTIQSGESGTQISRSPYNGTLPLNAHRPALLGTAISQALQRDLSTIPQLSSFVGRKNELLQLETAVVTRRKRLVALFGLGGQGKTALVAHFAMFLCHGAGYSNNTLHRQSSQMPFQRILWYSCHNAPSLTEILCHWLQQLSIKISTAELVHPKQLLSLLFNHLQHEAVLLVLDNFENFLSGEEKAGAYRRDYLEIEYLLERFAAVPHHGTLILTSREQPLSLIRLTDNPSVATIQLKGMSADDAAALLQSCQLSGLPQAFNTLTARYSGNPLALKIVAEAINELFAGDLRAFLEEETLIVDDIRQVLDQQFTRLSALEVEIMLWLAIEREAVTPQQIWANLIQPPSRNLFYEALRSLQRRFLIETDEYPKRFSGQLAVHLTLQTVVMEYVTEFFITTIHKELEAEQLDLFQRYFLIKAQAPDYIRQVQRDFILQPLLRQLTMQWGASAIESRLFHLLALLRARFGRTPGYAAANLLHLMLALAIDLRGKDFSHLAIWQADLRHAHLLDVNFAHADLKNSVFAEYFGNVTAVCFSPDNRLLATATTDGGIYLWRASDGQLAGICRGNGRWVWSLAFSPDGQTLGSGCADKLLRLWDISDIYTADADADFLLAAVLTKTLAGHNDAIFSVAFSPDGSLIASGSADSTVCLWHVAEGGVARRLFGHTAAVVSIAFQPTKELDPADPCGFCLASASRDGTVRLWDTATATTVQRLEGHTANVLSVAFQPGGDYLLSGGSDHTVRLWKVATGEQIYVFDDAQSTILSVACSTDLIAAAGEDYTIYIWELQTGKVSRTLSGHLGAVNSLAFSKDGYTLASGAFDQSIRLWDIHTGRVFRTYRGYRNEIKTLALHPSEQLLAHGNNNQSISLWHLYSATAMHNHDSIQAPYIGASAASIANAHAGIVRCVDFHPDGHCLASVGQDGMIRLWTVEDKPRSIGEFTSHIGALLVVRFSPNGEWLATASVDGKVALWHLQSQRCTHILHGHTQLVGSLVFTPDGCRLLSGSDDGTVLLWELNQLPLADHTSLDVTTPQRLLQTATDGVLALAISPNGQLLAIGGANPGVELWQLTNDERVQCYRTDSSTFAIAFSPDGSLLATGDGAHLITIWNLETNQQVSTLAEHQGVVRQLIFTQDGRRLYSSGDDEMMCLWENRYGGWHCVDTHHSSGPYCGLNIYNVTSINGEKLFALRALGAIDQIAPATVARSSYNIPTPLTPLCGRIDDMALLLDKLLDADTRLVTILGEGGIGKTSVAVEIARSLVGLPHTQSFQHHKANLFDDGVWFIPIAVIPADERGADLLVTAIAGVLNITFNQRVPPQQQLFEHLQERKLLLILDNFENLRHETGFLLELLLAAPAVKLLITSRQRLDIFAQVVYRLPGLAVPPDAHLENLTNADLLHYPSIQLFIEQAQRVIGSFALSSANRHHVVWLCRFVDGLPLGIKLAAAQLADWAIEDVIARVQRDLSALTSTTADLPKDQRSLHTVLTRSWENLPDSLIQLLTCCAVFEDSFGCAAATAVAAAEVTKVRLDELADRALLQMREDGRYVIHEFVRTFIRTHPGAKIAIDEAAHRHAIYYAHLLDTKGRRKHGTIENAQLLFRELANIRTAWHWALQQLDLDLLQQSIEGLFYIYERLGQFSEALHFITEAIATLERHLVGLSEQAHTEGMVVKKLGLGQISLGQAGTAFSKIDTSAKEVLADLHLYHGIINDLMGDLEETERAAKAAFTLGQELGKPHIVAHGSYLLALQAQQHGQFQDATRWIEQAAQLADENDLTEWQIAALNLQGIMLDMKGDHTNASAHYKQALPLAIQSNDRFQERLLVNNLGIVSIAKGDWEEADVYLQRNLALSEESGNPSRQSYALMNYALLLDAVGLYGQARQNLQKGLQIARAARHRQAEVYILQFLALIGFHSGHARVAANYAEEALALIEEHQFWQMKAASLAFLAHNLLALDEVERALACYAESIELWRVMNNQLEIGTALAGYAYASLRLGLLDQALACTESILPLLDKILTDNATEAMWVVLGCYFVLQEANDERRHVILQKGYQRLIQQAESIKNLEIRNAFLKNIYPHRTIIRATQFDQ